MKISTKSRYGLRLLIDLGLHKDEGYIPLKTIATRQQISDKYLEQIISALSKASIVKSTRGAQGGYMLAKDAKDISVGDILRTLEGSFTLVECAQPYEQCSRSAECAAHSVWYRMQRALEQVADETSLEELIEESIQNGGEPIVCNNNQ